MKIFGPDKQAADPLKGFFEVELDQGKRVVQYEPDPDLRDSEQFLTRTRRNRSIPVKSYPTPVMPVCPDKTKIGYEISFTRHFYKPKPMRSLEKFVEPLEKESEGVLAEILWSSN